MHNDDLYGYNLENFILTGKKIQVVYFDSSEQFTQSEKELDKIIGFNHNSNIAHYILINPENDEKHTSHL